MNLRKMPGGRAYIDPTKVVSIWSTPAGNVAVLFASGVEYFPNPTGETLENWVLALSNPGLGTRL